MDTSHSHSGSFQLALVLSLRLYKTSGFHNPEGGWALWCTEGRFGQYTEMGHWLDGTEWALRWTRRVCHMVSRGGRLCQPVLSCGGSAGANKLHTDWGYQPPTPGPLAKTTCPPIAFPSSEVSIP